MEEIADFMTGEGDWNTNDNLKSILRIKVVDTLNALNVKPLEGGSPIEDYGAAAAALGPVKAMLKRTGLQNAQTRTPLNAAEEKAVATLKDLFATIEDGTAYAKLVENYTSNK